MDTRKLQELALRDAVHIDTRAQLPQGRDKLAYSFTHKGVARTVEVGGTERQLLDLLRTRTVFCASRMAMGHYIHRLRHVYRIPIATYFYRDPQTGNSFGVHALETRVQPASVWETLPPVVARPLSPYAAGDPPCTPPRWPSPVERGCPFVAPVMHPAH